ncbi:hypothetical protein L226DRAFT_219435 [Lentinus tigrinus ALCF2SS1-7]|uniref:F-box domain-containing protein n=1 Tax=Lentinus tigrinus ALCF2SS1-6 TaxID=1328759 RepID=A0A5C2SDC5_9APHY|nr:hypothetical protein L227DRAFT_159264 [Lentinus tigrinus ALCF2SS1-6]RPD70752.1 hypothetical protein L226DRAFT_219435 [Lentinus tigrinus ALCF2SS1-7]
MSVFSLPAEVWHRILEYVPNTENTAVWLRTSMDISMLLPLSQTCRRFRDITLSHPALWQSISIGVKPELRGLMRNAIVRSRPCSLSVHVRLAAPSEDDENWSEDLRGLWPEVSARLRELHIEVWQFHALHWDEVFECLYPRLESFSCGNAAINGSVREPFPPFAQGRISHLHRLSLQSCSVVPGCHFPDLTHLALLGNDYMQDICIIELLGRCPNLQSLILSAGGLRNMANEPYIPSESDIIVSLPCLRRITLVNENKGDPLRSLYLYLRRLPKHPDGSSLHVLVGNWVNSKPDDYLVDGSIAPVKTIYIGLKKSSQR